MSEMVISAGVPEVDMGTQAPTSSGVPATFSGAWGDFSKDMAAIEAEMGQQAEPAQPEAIQPAQAVVTPAPVTPETVVAQQPVVVPPAVATAPVPATPPVEVPEKFRGADGKPDQEKILKSYFEAEKALKKAQNQINQPVAAAPAPAGQPQSTPQDITPFERKVAQDIWANGQAGFSEAQAISLARVQVKGWEAQHQATIAATSREVGQFGEALAQQQSRSELETLAKNPATSFVLSPQGYADLVRIREENPEINASQNPWSKAVKILLGERAMTNQQAGLGNMPIPTGVQQAVPPLPVTPAQPVSTPVQLNTQEQIEAYVKTLNPEQEAKFWTLQGLKWDAPRQQFKGI